MKLHTVIILLLHTLIIEIINFNPNNFESMVVALDLVVDFNNQSHVL
jgi:hypothetical protein